MFWNNMTMAVAPTRPKAGGEQLDGAACARNATCMASFMSRASAAAVAVRMLARVESHAQEADRGRGEAPDQEGQGAEQPGPAKLRPSPLTCRSPRWR
ncbi:MAG: hypothetical protein R2704_02485 [Microthrixaceae bacterium]